MSINGEEIIRRFVANAGKRATATYTDPGTGRTRQAFPEGSASSLYTQYDTKGRVVELDSYGAHFPLARLQLTPSGKPKRWLLNGDRYANGGFSQTNQYNDYMRNVVQSGTVPWFIVPFSVLREAGIHPDTIMPLEVEAESYTYETCSAATLAEVPRQYKMPDRTNPDMGTDGRYHWTAERHWLGGSVFRARYRDRNKNWRNSNSWAYFVTAFDYNEPFPLWFMAQLPRGATPATVAEAIQALKPEAVRHAEAAGIPVLRHGDVFIIQSGHSTRDLPKLGAVPVTPGRDGRQFVNDSHTATEVRHSAAGPGKIWVRGIMRHRPRNRRPDHRNLTLWDGRTWGYIAMNTVPPSRSWSLGANVD